MSINIEDIEGLISCDGCGCVYDIDKCGYVKDSLGLNLYICPVCKHENYK